MLAVPLVIKYKGKTNKNLVSLNSSLHDKKWFELGVTAANLIEDTTLSKYFTEFIIKSKFEVICIATHSIATHISFVCFDDQI